MRDFEQILVEKDLVRSLVNWRKLMLLGLSAVVATVVAAGFAVADVEQAGPRLVAERPGLGPEEILQGEALDFLPPPRKLMEQPETFFHRVPPPRAIQEGTRTESATITVNFLAAGQQDRWGTTCTTFPAAAQAAFNHAAEIWSTLIESSVPIVIEACWANLGGGGVLGYGGALGYYRDFPGAPIANTWYQVAIANALSGVDRNGATPEIGTTYNAQYTGWYYGTDGNPAWNQIDLVSVVLHEICHGLGFSGSMTVSGGQGSWGSGTAYPDVYDRFAEDSAGTSLLNTAVYPNPSVALGNALTSNAVYFNGTHANAGNAGQRVRLYAPATWQQGSSYSHLDEIFNGTINALMTYAINWGEALHHPGPVTMGLLQDLGWTPAGQEFPNIDVSPLSLSASQAPDTTSQQTLTVANTGDAELDWEIEQEPESASLELPGAGVFSPESAVELILDDGTVENNIGIGGNSELLWLNRFTPNPVLFPFEIDQISVWFSGGTSNVAVGDSITLILFENTAGNSNPATGANHLASIPATVQALDSWNVYTLPTPVTFNGPGDALIGVIGMETPGSAYFPAALDTTTSQGRSWAGWYTTSPPPSPPTLPPDHTWGLIDSFGAQFAGNWMVRAGGQSFGPCTGLANVPWLGVNPDSGTTAAGGTTPVTVTFNSAGLAAGTYNANLCVFSNDPDPGPGNETELVIVPVSLEVTGPPPPATVTVLAEPPAGGSVTGGGLYTIGDMATVEAFPEPGWNFQYWQDNGGQIPYNPFTFEVMSDITLTAVFVESGPQLTLGHGHLNYGGTDAGDLITGEQVVTVDLGGAPLAWTAVPDHGDIVVTGGSGSGAGQFTVSIAPGATSDFTSTVTVTAPGADNSPQTVAIAYLHHDSGTTTGPFGAFETPAHGADDLSGAIPVTGWVLDDIEVVRVDIWRDPMPGEAVHPNGFVYLGDATFVPGARPDVEAAYPDHPLNYRAGWGYMLLSNFLPDNGVAGTVGGNGTFVLHAIAHDAEGHETLLGSHTIHCDNDNATLPFGTIDVPGQGDTVSGTIHNWAWALTPQPGIIPTDGSTITVYINGAPVGQPVYNLYREDIATLFPGYANTDGAVGYFELDTTTLPNGLHTIAWSVGDDLGRVQGIGSRYFWVFN